MKVRREYIVSLLFLLVLVAGCVVFPAESLAGPGGIIVKAAKTKVGMILTFGLGIVFAPLIMYIIIIQAVGIRRTRNVLKKLAAINPSFRWTMVNERIHGIITQVYSAWELGDIARASEWMTEWYWQNQKLTVLDRWERQGLINYCELNKINSIKPIYVEYSEVNQGDGEGSRLVLLVRVNLRDYLYDSKTMEIVEGDKRDKDSETVWTLLLTEGRWKLTLIEESIVMRNYVRTPCDVTLAEQQLAASATRR